MRWLVRIGVAVLVLVLTPILLLSFFLDSAASRGASYALGVDTHMSLVLRPLAGRVSVLSLEVANPPGFESDHFLRLEGGHFDLRTASLREQTLESPLLRLEGVDVNLERRGGRQNYDAILANLARFESSAASESDPAEAGGGKQFVIRELEILNVVADVDAVELLGDRGRIHVEIPEIRLSDVGGSQGVSMAELSNIVVKTVLAAVALQGAALPPELAGALRGGLGDLTGVTFDTGRAAVSRAAGAAADDLATNAAKKLEEEAARGLRGLLGRGKDD